MPKIRTIPEVKGISDARKTLPDMVAAVQQGEVYVVKSPKGKALMMGLDEFRDLQDSYLDLESRLESVRMLEDEGMRAALAASFEDEEEKSVPLSQLRSQYLAEQGFAHLAEEAAEEDLKEELLASMNAAAMAAAGADPATDEQRAELLAALAKATDQLVKAAASAAGVAAARAAEEVAGVSEGPTEEAATRAAEVAAGETAERFLLSR